MTIHDTGPGTETDDTQERKIVWGHDGAHGDDELERPFIDDLVRRVWSRLRNVFVGQDPMGKHVPSE